MGFLNNIFGDNELVNIDKQIDDILASVPIRDYGGETSESDASEVIHQLLAVEDRFASPETLKKNPFYKDFTDHSGIMNEVGTLLDKLTLQPDRAARYKTYQEIYASIPMIKKMLQTWLSNLIQKNPVSGRSLLIKDLDEDTKDIDSQDDEYRNKKTAAKLFVEEILDFFDFVNKLKYRILPDQQMYGDSFVEVINLNEFKLDNSKNQKNNDVLDNFDTNLFLGESVFSVDGSSSKKKTFSSTTRGTPEKVQKLLEKTSSDQFSVEDACRGIADILMDTTWDPSERVLTEAYADELANQNKSREIILSEKHVSKSVDSAECFYEYVANSMGDMKPLLKFKKNLNSAVEEKTPEKRRGRPPKKKQLTEDDSMNSFEAKMKKAGIQTKLKMDNAMMLVHKPSSIVILTTVYNTKLGYVEIAEKENVENYNINNQLSTIIGRIVSVSNNTTNSQEEVLARIVKIVIKKIVEQSNSKKNKDGKKDVDTILNSLSPDAYNAIKKLVIETYKDNPKKMTFRRLKARFIPIERMFQFTIPSPDYAPYGLSFIDPLVLQGKMYILSQLSNVIMKLSRAAPVRKWIIDVGATQDHAKYLQQLKRDMYNQKVTIDNALSFKSMAQILSDFKDIAVFRKGGVSHLDMEVQSLGDPSVKTQDLEDARRELIALSGIPAPYLGYGDVVELQSQLVHANLAFATQIADIIFFPRLWN